MGERRERLSSRGNSLPQGPEAEERPQPCGDAGGRPAAGWLLVVSSRPLKVLGQGMTRPRPCRVCRSPSPYSCVGTHACEDEGALPPPVPAALPGVPPCFSFPLCCPACCGASPGLRAGPSDSVETTASWVGVLTAGHRLAPHDRTREPETARPVTWRGVRDRDGEGGDRRGLRVGRNTWETRGRAGVST